MSDFTAPELYNASIKIGLVETLYIAYGKSIKATVSFSKGSCKTDIDDLNLSTRSSNALKRGGMMTVGQVVNAIADDGLTGTRNLGRKSLNEIKTRIMAFGYEKLPAPEKIRFWEDIIQKNKKAG